jgi:K+-sensing histidine kinase KdpD
LLSSYVTIWPGEGRLGEICANAHKEAIWLCASGHKERVKYLDTSSLHRNKERMDHAKAAIAAMPEASRWRAPPTLAGVFAVLALMGVTVAAGTALRETLPTSSVPLLFLLAVLVASVRYGFWTGILASFLAFLADNFFFIEPYFTFHVGQASDWLTLAVLLAAGATTGFLVGRLREEADAASARAHALEVMSQCAAGLAGARDAVAVTSVLLGALSRSWA